jgi:hypothetical protein
LRTYTWFTAMLLDEGNGAVPIAVHQANQAPHELFNLICHCRRVNSSVDMYDTYSENAPKMFVRRQAGKEAIWLMQIHDSDNSLSQRLEMQTKS